MPQFDIPNATSAAPALSAGQQAVVQQEKDQQALAQSSRVANDPTLADIFGDKASAADPNAPASDSGVAELGQFFGIEGNDPVATKAALKPVLDMMARSGDLTQQPQQQSPPPQQYEQYQQPPQQQQQQQLALQQEAPTDVTFDDLDLGEDASPQIVKAFRAMGDRSRKAIKAAVAQSTAAQAAVAATSRQFQQQQQDTEQAAQSEVTTRAVGYLDSLASPTYGVGNNRTLVQTLHSQAVMTEAGNLIRGMKSYGQVLPIEKVMSAAIFLVEGEVPQAPVQQKQEPAALNPTAPKGPAPVPQQSVGSSGAGQQLMADTEFLDGARAIMAR